MTPISLPTKSATTDRKPGQPWPLAEAAVYLGRCERTLTRAEVAGKLRLIRIGRAVYVPDVEMVRVADQGL